MKQANIFLNGEGDRWYERNRNKIRDNAAHDPVIATMLRLCLHPTNVLEIGCSNGWRLGMLHARFDCQCVGVDASQKAIAEANERLGVVGIHSSATEILFKPGRFDLIIFGFCLYVVDRESLFETVFQSDRYLANGGHIIIHDFLPTMPHAKIYHHIDDDKVKSYKMDYSQLWLSNPAYSLVEKKLLPGATPDDTTTVTVLKKDIDAWPTR